MNNNILLVLIAGAIALLFSFLENKMDSFSRRRNPKNEDNRKKYC